MRTVWKGYLKISMVCWRKKSHPCWPIVPNRSIPTGIFSRSSGTAPAACCLRKKYFGSLAVATRAGCKWTYRGRVGSGFADRELAALRRRLESLQTDAPPFPVPDPNAIQWVQPKLKCEVVFQEETAQGLFRAPVFKGLTS